MHLGACLSDHFRKVLSLDPEKFFRRARVETVRPWQFSCTTEVRFDAVRRFLQHLDLIGRQHVLDINVAVHLNMEALCRGQRGERPGSWFRTHRYALVLVESC